MGIMTDTALPLRVTISTSGGGAFMAVIYPPDDVA
jgi:hypothetical protein